MSSSSQQQQQQQDTHGEIVISSEDAAVLAQTQQELARAAGSSSSRAASRASSHGMLMIDPSSLRQLDHHFARAMAQIGHQIQYLTAQCEAATQVMYDESAELSAEAALEMARQDQILADLDALDLEFERIRSLHTIVKNLRQRAADLEREVNQSSSSRHRHHHHHSSGGGGHHGGHSSHRHGHSSSRHRH